MNYLVIIKMIGVLLQFEGAFMLLPFIVGLIYREQQAKYLLIVAVGAFLLGTLLRLLKPKSQKLHAREGFVITALAWIVMSVTGALPFYYSKEIPSFTDAVFESASGFSTTGASILTDIEGMAKCMLFWRSFTHWIGGMGVLVFILIFMKSTADEMNIMKAESPGPSVDKLVPKVKTTAFILYAIYTALTVLTIIALIIAGMPVFDSFCIGFGNAGTGGFGVRADSCASYSPMCQRIIIVSILLFGANFKFYFLIIIKKFRDLLKCEEVFWYLIIYVAAVALVLIGILKDYSEFEPALRTAAFQVASVMTTTGYATTDFNLWANMPRAVMVLVMFTGACAGSTGGGMKVSRILLYFKQIKREISKNIHPRSVTKIRLDGEVVDDDILRATNVYLMAFFFVYIFSFLLMCTNGFDLETSFTAVVATLSNIGPGLGLIGPCGGFSGFNTVSKWTAIFDMIAGRLELFPVLIMLAPSTWRKK